MEEVKGYSNSREEEEEEGGAEEIITREESSSSKQQHYPSFSLSSPSSTTNYTSHLPPHHHHHQNPWHGMTHDHDHHQSPETTESPNSSSTLGLPHHHQDATPSNFTNHTKHHQIDFMDLSLGNKNTDEIPNVNVSSEEENLMKLPPPTEKEHMFDKVVTPSDVGKLNRLVIPKQHAEKYFPLDSTSNEKGLLLNFEDRNGKLWRFRYSYWNSSQSYVMTKGWSRFVKEKKLDAGDIVSFQRGVGEKYRHRLYIDWKRRPHNVDSSTNPFFSPFFHPPPSIGRFYTLPNSSHYNYNNYHPFHHYRYGNYSSGSGSLFYLNQRQQQEGANNVVSPMIIDSVPVVHQYHNHNQHGNTSAGSASNNSTSQGKRLRLFGVNMECASSSSSASEDHNVTMANSSASQRVEATSMLFDLDPSLQYRK